jgi:hypothetical protein
MFTSTAIVWPTEVAADVVGSMRMFGTTWAKVSFEKAKIADDRRSAISIAFEHFILISSVMY